MTTLRLILMSALFMPLLGCRGRALPEEDSGYSDLPTVQPAEWENNRSLPGFGGGGGQGY